MTEWMSDISRGPWVANSLKHRRGELREAAKRCRKAFNKEYMGVPAKWLADVYDEAAEVLEKRLREIEAHRR